MKVIDVHAHYGEWFFPIMMTERSRILRLMDAYGIEIAVFSSSLAIVYDMEEGNADLNEFLGGSPRFYGYVVLNPNYVDLSVQEIERYLRSPKFVGVKIHPDYAKNSVSCPESLGLLEKASKLKKVALLHTWGEEQVRATSTVADTFPDLTVIMGHMGGDGREGAGWKAGIEAAKGRQNLYLEVCGSTLHRDRIREAVESVGDDRILYGSDMTLLNPAITVGMIEEADVSEHARERMFYQNAKRVFPF